MPSSISKTVSKNKKSRKTPLWDGPCSNTPNGGVTQSLISRFLACRERFRVHAIEGWQPRERFNHLTEYGSMWHVCEEGYAKYGKLGPSSWLLPLQEYCNGLLKQFPDPKSSKEINKWYICCKLQFPVYLDYWKKHKDERKKKPLLQEYKFTVPHELPSGREVILRGKWDGVSRIGKEVFLDEHKSKGTPDKDEIITQLKDGDNQTMMYLSALREFGKYSPIAGVRYNVVRRPLSGGRHSIKQKRGQTTGQFYEELRDRIASDPEFFFFKFTVEVTDREIDEHIHQTLNPILEGMCDWYEWVTSDLGKKDPFCSIHFKHPRGIFSPVNEGRYTDIDHYIGTKNTAGMKQTDTLFRELQDA